jgi:hypothetical protein
LRGIADRGGNPTVGVELVESDSPETYHAISGREGAPNAISDREFSGENRSFHAAPNAFPIPERLSGALAR